MASGAVCASGVSVSVTFSPVWGRGPLFWGRRVWFARGVHPIDSLWAAQSGAGASPTPAFRSRCLVVVPGPTRVMPAPIGDHP